MRFANGPVLSGVLLGFTTYDSGNAFILIIFDKKIRNFGSQLVHFLDRRVASEFSVHFVSNYSRSIFLTISRLIL